MKKTKSTPLQTRIKKAKEKIEADPLRSEILLTLGKYSSTPEISCKFYKRAIKIEEIKLGKTYLEKHKSNLWFDPQARIYLRATYLYAWSLWKGLNKLDESLLEFSAILKHCPSDTMGVRFYLVALLLETERYSELIEVLNHFKNDFSATWKYTKALIQFKILEQRLIKKSKKQIALKKQKQEENDQGQGQGQGKVNKQKKKRERRLTAEQVTCSIIERRVISDPDLQRMALKANQLLWKAVCYNKFVAQYLLNQKKLPNRIPKTSQIRSKNEAIEYVILNQQFWIQTTGSINWLKFFISRAFYGFPIFLKKLESEKKYSKSLNQEKKKQPIQKIQNKKQQKTTNNQEKNNLNNQDHNNEKEFYINDQKSIDQENKILQNEKFINNNQNKINTNINNNNNKEPYFTRNNNEEESKTLNEISNNQNENENDNNNDENTNEKKFVRVKVNLDNNSGVIELLESLTESVQEKVIKILNEQNLKEIPQLQNLKLSEISELKKIKELSNSNLNTITSQRPNIINQRNEEHLTQNQFFYESKNNKSELEKVFNQEYYLKNKQKVNRSNENNENLNNLSNNNELIGETSCNYSIEEENEETNNQTNNTNNNKEIEINIKDNILINNNNNIGNLNNIKNINEKQINITEENLIISSLNREPIFDLSNLKDPLLEISNLGLNFNDFQIQIENDENKNNNIQKGKFHLKINDNNLEIKELKNKNKKVKKLTNKKEQDGDDVYDDDDNDGEDNNKNDNEFFYLTSDDALEEKKQIEKNRKKRKQVKLIQQEQEKLTESLEIKQQGNELYKNRRFQDAIEKYTEAIKYIPKRFITKRSYFYSNRALCYLNLKEYEKVIGDCTQANQDNPENIKSLYRRAQAYLYLNNFKKSKDDVKEILQMDFSNNDAKRLFEEIENREKEFKKNK